MEDSKVYKKVGKRYVPIGQTYHEDWLRDGIWLVNSGEGFKSMSNMFYKMGSCPNIKDIAAYGSLLNHVKDVSSYLLKLGESGSEEYQEAKEMVGGFLNGPVSIYNISSSDLVSLLFRKLQQQLEKDNGGKQSK